MKSAGARRSGRSIGRLGLVFLLLWAPAVTLADGAWRTAKNYSAQVNSGTFQAAKLSLQVAVEILKNAEANLRAAEADLQTVANGGGSPQAIAAAVNAVANAAAAVTKATVAVAQATIVVSTAATFNGGTVLGEGADWLITFCWDPICELNAEVPFYVAPTDAELDALYGALLPVLELDDGFSASPAELLALNAIEPGVGDLLLDYARATLRVNVIALRGAAAFSAGNCPDTRVAAADLRPALTRLGDAAAAFGAFLSTVETVEGDPGPEVEALVLDLFSMQVLVDEYADPLLAQRAINSALTGVEFLQDGLAKLSSPDGSPRALEGVGGFVPPLTVAEYLGFLQDVARDGAIALPPNEVATMDALFAALGIFLAGAGSVGPDLAAYVAEGDTADEQSLFAPDLLLSQSLITSKPFRWDAIDLDESPLLAACEAQPIPEIGGVARGFYLALLLLCAAALRLRVVSRRSLT